MPEMNRPLTAIHAAGDCRFSNYESVQVELSIQKVTSMRFRSELLNPPPMNNSEPTLTRIYDVYMTPDGRLEGEGKDLGDILDEGHFPPND